MVLYKTLAVSSFLKIFCYNICSFSCPINITSCIMTSTGFVAILHPQVDYKEKAAAVGQFPRSFQRRDIGITDREILISRRIGM